MKSRGKGIGKLLGYIIVVALLTAVALGVFGNTMGSAVNI